MPSPADGEEAGRRRLRGLLTIRIMGLAELLRRSSTLANRRAFELSWIEWRVLSLVGEHAPLTLGGLADLLNLNAAQVSRAVKGLAERGLLSRARRPGGPSVTIALTAAGAALHDRMVDQAIARHDFLVEGIDPEELAQALRVLDAMRGQAALLLEQERAALPPSEEDG